MKKLAIISSHPIQYNAPVFKLLSERKNIQIKVFYTWENSKDGIYDKKFGKPVKWDIPLLEGYEYQFIKNISKDQGTHHFKGLINPDLNFQIKKWGAEAVLIFGWSFQSHFSAMRHFKGKIPVLFRGDSHLLDEVAGYKTFLRRVWLKFVYRYIDIAFYVGTNNKAYYLKHGLKENQLIYAPHAIENERFDNANNAFSEKAEHWRNELNYTKNDIVFLFVGKFEKKKNPLLLLQVAIKLQNKSNLKFLFVGNGELENEMKQYNSKNVSFLTFQNQSVMPVIYRIGDVFVLPSKGPGETWGLAVNEAMVCGKPILVSDKVGCAIDLVENEKNGYIFKSEDIDDLVEKVNYFNSENISKFGKQSKEIIKDYSFENIVIAIEKAINQIV